MPSHGAGAPPGTGQLVLVFRYRSHERRLLLVKADAGPPAGAWQTLCSKAWDGVLHGQMKLTVVSTADHFDIDSPETAAKAWTMANVRTKRLWWWNRHGQLSKFTKPKLCTNNGRVKQDFIFLSVQELGVLLIDVWLSREQRREIKRKLLGRDRAQAAPVQDPGPVDDSPVVPHTRTRPDIIPPTPAATPTPAAAAARLASAHHLSSTRVARASSQTHLSPTCMPPKASQLGFTEGKLLRALPDGDSIRLCLGNGGEMLQQRHIPIKLKHVGDLLEGESAGRCLRRAVRSAHSEFERAGRIRCRHILRPAGVLYDFDSVFASVVRDANALQIAAVRIETSDQTAQRARVADDALATASRRRHPQESSMLYRAAAASGVKLDRILGVFRAFYEHAPSGSIATHIASFGPLSAALLAMQTRRLLSALSALHSRGMIHGCVDETTCMVDATGRLRLDVSSMASRCLRASLRSTSAKPTAQRGSDTADAARVVFFMATGTALEPAVEAQARARQAQAAAHEIVSSVRGLPPDVIAALCRFDPDAMNTSAPCSPRAASAGATLNPTAIADALRRFHRALIQQQTGMKRSCEAWDAGSTGPVLARVQQPGISLPLTPVSERAESDSVTAASGSAGEVLVLSEPEVRMEEGGCESSGSVEPLAAGASNSGFQWRSISDMSGAKSQSFEDKSDSVHKQSDAWSGTPVPCECPAELAGGSTSRNSGCISEPTRAVDHSGIAAGMPPMIAPRAPLPHRSHDPSLLVVGSSNDRSTRLAAGAVGVGSAGARMTTIEDSLVETGANQSLSREIRTLAVDGTGTGAAELGPSWNGRGIGTPITPQDMLPVAKGLPIGCLAPATSLTRSSGSQTRPVGGSASSSTESLSPSAARTRILAAIESTFNAAKRAGETAAEAVRAAPGTVVASCLPPGCPPQLASFLALALSSCTGDGVPIRHLLRHEFIVGSKTASLVPNGRALEGSTNSKQALAHSRGTLDAFVLQGMSGEADGRSLASSQHGSEAMSNERCNTLSRASHGLHLADASPTASDARTGAQSFFLPDTLDIRWKCFTVGRRSIAAYRTDPVKVAEAAASAAASATASILAERGGLDTEATAELKREVEGAIGPLRVMVPEWVTSVRAAEALRESALRRETAENWWLALGRQAHPGTAEADNGLVPDWPRAHQACLDGSSVVAALGYDPDAVNEDLGAVPVLLGGCNEATVDDSDDDEDDFMAAATAAPGPVSMITGSASRSRSNDSPVVSETNIGQPVTITVRVASRTPSAAGATSSVSSSSGAGERQASNSSQHVVLGPVDDTMDTVQSRLASELATGDAPHPGVGLLTSAPSLSTIGLRLDGRSDEHQPLCSSVAQLSVDNGHGDSASLAQRATGDTPGLRILAGFGDAEARPQMLADDSLSLALAQTDWSKRSASGSAMTPAAESAAVCAGSAGPALLATSVLQPAKEAGSNPRSQGSEVALVSATRTASIETGAWKDPVTQDAEANIASRAGEVEAPEEFVVVAGRRIQVGGKAVPSRDDSPSISSASVLRPPGLKASHPGPHGLSTSSLASLRPPSMGLAALGLDTGASPAFSGQPNTYTALFASPRVSTAAAAASASGAHPAIGMRPSVPTTAAVAARVMYLRESSSLAVAAGAQAAAEALRASGLGLELDAVNSTAGRAREPLQNGLVGLNLGNGISLCLPAGPPGVHGGSLQPLLAGDVALNPAVPAQVPMSATEAAERLSWPSGLGVVIHVPILGSVGLEEPFFVQRQNSVDREVSGLDMELNQRSGFPMPRMVSTAPEFESRASHSSFEDDFVQHRSAWRKGFPAYPSRDGVTRNDSAAPPNSFVSRSLTMDQSGSGKHFADMATVEEEGRAEAGAAVPARLPQQPGIGGIPMLSLSRHPIQAPGSLLLTSQRASRKSATSDDTTGSSSVSESGEQCTPVASAAVWFGEGGAMEDPAARRRRQSRMVRGASLAEVAEVDAGVMAALAELNAEMQSVGSGNSMASDPREGVPMQAKHLSDSTVGDDDDDDDGFLVNRPGFSATANKQRGNCASPTPGNVTRSKPGSELNDDLPIVGRHSRAPVNGLVPADARPQQHHAKERRNSCAEGCGRPGKVVWDGSADWWLDDDDGAKEAAEDLVVTLSVDHGWDMFDPRSEENNTFGDSAKQRDRASLKATDVDAFGRTRAMRLFMDSAGGDGPASAPQPRKLQSPNAAAKSVAAEGPPLASAAWGGLAGLSRGQVDQQAGPSAATPAGLATSRHCRMQSLLEPVSIDRAVGNSMLCEEAQEHGPQQCSTDGGIALSGAEAWTGKELEAECSRQPQRALELAAGQGEPVKDLQPCWPSPGAFTAATAVVDASIGQQAQRCQQGVVESTTDTQGAMRHGGDGDINGKAAAPSPAPRAVKPTPVVPTLMDAEALGASLRALRGKQTSAADAADSITGEAEDATIGEGTHAASRRDSLSTGLPGQVASSNASPAGPTSRSRVNSLTWSQPIEGSERVASDTPPLAHWQPDLPIVDGSVYLLGCTFAADRLTAGDSQRRQRQVRPGFTDPPTAVAATTTTVTAQFEVTASPHPSLNEEEQIEAVSDIGIDTVASPASASAADGHEDDGEPPKPEHPTQPAKDKARAATPAPMPRATAGARIVATCFGPSGDTGGIPRSRFEYSLGPSPSLPAYEAQLEDMCAAAHRTERQQTSSGKQEAELSAAGDTRTLHGPCCDALCDSLERGCPACNPAGSQRASPVMQRLVLGRIIADFWLPRARRSLQLWDRLGYDCYGRGFGNPGEVGSGVQQDRAAVAERFGVAPMRPPTVPRNTHTPVCSERRRARASAAAELLVGAADAVTVAAVPVPDAATLAARKAARTKPRLRQVPEAPQTGVASSGPLPHSPAGQRATKQGQSIPASVAAVAAIAPKFEPAPSPMLAVVESRYAIASEAIREANSRARRLREGSGAWPHAHVIHGQEVLSATTDGGDGGCDMPLLQRGRQPHSFAVNRWSAVKLRQSHLQRVVTATRSEYLDHTTSVVSPGRPLHHLDTGAAAATSKKGQREGGIGLSDVGDESTQARVIGQHRRRATGVGRVVSAGITGSAGLQGSSIPAATPEEDSEVGKRQQCLFKQLLARQLVQQQLYQRLGHSATMPSSVLSAPLSPSLHRGTPLSTESRSSAQTGVSTGAHSGSPPKLSSLKRAQSTPPIPVVDAPGGAPVIDHIPSAQDSLQSSAPWTKDSKLPHLLVIADSIAQASPSSTDVHASPVMTKHADTAKQHRRVPPPPQSTPPSIPPGVSWSTQLAKAPEPDPPVGRPAVISSSHATELLAARVQPERSLSFSPRPWRPAPLSSRALSRVAYAIALSSAGSAQCKPKNVAPIFHGQAGLPMQKPAHAASGDAQRKPGEWVLSGGSASEFLAALTAASSTEPSNGPTADQGKGAGTTQSSQLVAPPRLSAAEVEALGVPELVEPARLRQAQSESAHIADASADVQLVDTALAAPPITNQSQAPKGGWFSGGSIAAPAGWMGPDASACGSESQTGHPKLTVRENADAVSKDTRIIPGAQEVKRASGSAVSTHSSSVPGPQPETPEDGSTVYGSEVYTIYKAGSRWAFSATGSASVSPVKQESQAARAEICSGEATDEPNLPGVVADSPARSVGFSSLPPEQNGVIRTKPGAVCTAIDCGPLQSAAGIPLVQPTSYGDKAGSSGNGEELGGIHPTLFSDGTLPEGLQWTDTARSGLATFHSGLSSSTSAHGAFGICAAYAIRSPKSHSNSAASAADSANAPHGPSMHSNSAAVLAVVIEEYNAADDGELSVEAGTIGAVEHEDESGWWECRVVPMGALQTGTPPQRSRCRGFLPCTFLQWATRDDIDEAAVPAELVEALHQGVTELVSGNMKMQPGQKKSVATATDCCATESPNRVLADCGGRVQSGCLETIAAPLAGGRVSGGLASVQEEQFDEDDNGGCRPTDEVPEPASSGADRLSVKRGSGLWRYNIVNDRWERRDPGTGSVQTSEDPFAEEWAVADIDEVEWDLDDFADADDEDDDVLAAADGGSASVEGLNSRESQRVMARVVSAGLRSVDSGFVESGPDGALGVGTIPPGGEAAEGGNMVYVAHSAFAGNPDEGELALVAGDTIVVDVFDDSGWWEGMNTRTNMRGWLPSTFVQPRPVLGCCD